jgi:murein DD-endopeptidase MepM/ murein hydrolase activator NlpD
VSSKPPSWINAHLPQLSWGLVVLMIALLAAVLLWRNGAQSSTARGSNAKGLEVDLSQPAGAPVALPAFQLQSVTQAIFREPLMHTIQPSDGGNKVIDYTITKGDSVFGIAKSFDISPETVLWANYETLNDNPDLIAPGEHLFIPPENGVYYKWKDGDTIEAVAARFDAPALDIISWPGNNLDVANPTVQPDTYILVPGGHREFRTWIMPTIPRGPAGVNKSIYGVGACDTSGGGAYGTGTFVWPAPGHGISGNDYWSGHLGIDVAALMGTPIYASDSGVVVYAGPIGGGYGNMVEIDHGNGYQTLYAHLSSIAVRCGSSVGQGQIIAYAGSTGNSTGPHLHFEVRYMGGFINPHSVLP